MQYAVKHTVIPPYDIYSVLYDSCGKVTPSFQHLFHREPHTFLRVVFLNCEINKSLLSTIIGLDDDIL